MAKKMPKKMWGYAFLLASTLFVKSSTALAQEVENHTIAYDARGPVVGQLYTDPKTLAPIFQTVKKAGNNKSFEVSISEMVFAEATPKEVSDFAKNIESEIKLQTQTIIVKKQNFQKVLLTPYRSVNGRFEHLLSFKLTYTEKFLPSTQSLRGNNWQATSELASGTWYKVETGQAGVYKMDYQFLKGMGLAVDNLDPRNLRLAGHGGDMLPEACSPLVYDDLQENAIVVVGESDGKFDAGDYILFYAHGLDKWAFHAGDSLFHHKGNIYAEKAYYFLTAGDKPGKRIAEQNYTASGSPTVLSTYTNFISHEQDLTSIGHTGRDWVGEEFDKVLNLSKDVNLYQPVSGGQAIISSQVVSKAFEQTNFAMTIAGMANFSQSVGATSPVLGAPYAVDAFNSFVFNMNGSPSKLTVNYQFNKLFQSSKGWLDFFEINYPSNLKVNGGQCAFRSSYPLVNGLTEYRYHIEGSNITVWEVSSPMDIKSNKLSATGNGFEFDADTSKKLIKEYVAFDGSSFLKPGAVVKISSQNIHAMATPDFVIVSYPEYSNEARRLAAHRNIQGIKTVVIEPQQIYNEFSSGKQDISAIRNMMKMWYDRSGGQKPEYLMLFGDASYDYKDRVKNNTNLVPTYESRESFLDESYCSDDYFGQLDDSEGIWIAEEGLDIAVGRIPVHSVADAKGAIDKILTYESAQSFGDWRNNVLVIGDDEDNNTHMQAAESIAGMVSNNGTCYHIDKIYLDAYKKQVVNGVPAYPDVNDELKRQLLRGCLIVNYSGHGGTSQWAHEGIFNSNDIDAMKNLNKLPLFMAATCDFGPYDNPAYSSAGEKLVTNSQGGAIGFLGTTRIATTGQNNPVNAKFFNGNIFLLTNGKYPSVGQVYQQIKVTGNGWLRNFTYLGDPSLTLGLPMVRVVTDSINGTAAGTDTLKALKTVTFSGQVQELNGQLSSGFNGTVFVNVYDKPSPVTTLGNEPGSPITTFSLEKNVLYKGKASVKAGRFNFNFIVPKDINYQWGIGQISYYANDNSREGQGCSDVTVGGTAELSAKDTICPSINLYINDLSFVNGGVTNSSPVLMVKLKDESGINTTGSGVGRNLTATLDGKKVFVVNDFYQSDLNDFQSGMVKYPMSGLETGKHSITFKAWDVCNNSCEATLEFEVKETSCIELSHVLNYPNPFTSKTTFEFDHNRAGDNLTVQVQIISVTGQVIRNLTTNEPYAYGHFSQLDWDGTDDYGSKVGRGVYLYRLRVKDSTCDAVETIGKLVLL